MSPGAASALTRTPRLVDVPEVVSTALSAVLTPRSAGVRADRLAEHGQRCAQRVHNRGASGSRITSVTIAFKNCGGRSSPVHSARSKATRPSAVTRIIGAESGFTARTGGSTTDDHGWPARIRAASPGLRTVSGLGPRSSLRYTPGRQPKSAMKSRERCEASCSPARVAIASMLSGVSTSSILAISTLSVRRYVLSCVPISWRKQVDK